MVVKDEADVITASLLDACRWSDKIIIIDNGSTDGTWEIIQQLSQAHHQIIPWLRYEGPFHIGLRAKAFRAFRHEMTRHDWWNVRLDADEFYPDDVRAFLSSVPSRYKMVKKESTDYILTEEDCQSISFTGDFKHDRSMITHSLPVHRQERRFMRHSPLLCWLDKWRYPHPWGRVYTSPIRVEHYQYRSPEQMAKRFHNRRQAKQDGCGSFSHEKGAKWEDYVISNKQLADRFLMADLRASFAASDRVMYSGRNTLKLIGDDIVVKAFHQPRFPNNLIYGLLRASKAKRSYFHALRMHHLTPEPLAYCDYRKKGLLRDSYYACRLSSLPFRWREIARDPMFPNREEIAKGIGRFMAAMHERGCFSLDFSGGNILVNGDGSEVQLVDLNRMQTMRFIDLKKGCSQTRRLHLTEDDCRHVAEGYAQTRGFDTDTCYKHIIQHHIPI